MPPPAASLNTGPTGWEAGRSPPRAPRTRPRREREVCEKAAQGLDRRQYWPAGVLPSHKPPDHLKESTQRDRISHPDTDEGGAVEPGPWKTTSTCGRATRACTTFSEPCGAHTAPTASEALRRHEDVFAGAKGQESYNPQPEQTPSVAVPISHEFTGQHQTPATWLPRGTRARGSSRALAVPLVTTRGHVKSLGVVVCPAPAWCTRRATCLPGFLADLPGRRRALDQKPAGAGADALRRHSWLLLRLLSQSHFLPSRQRRSNIRR